MTCEISIMNLQAVVLAADSAMTVKQWVNGEEETRFFKGTNKIFQLSNHHPVGLMIFGAASLQEVPWELIVKDFRETLGTKSFNDLAGYAQEMFGFVREHQQLFPDEYQDKLFMGLAERAAIINALIARSKDQAKAAKDSAEKTAAYKEWFESRLKSIDGEAVPSPFQQSDLDTTLASRKADLQQLIQKEIAENRLDKEIDPEVLAEIAIKDLIKHYKRFMRNSSTGVVVAGFGDKDYFPGFNEYRCYGLLLGKFLHDETDTQRVNVGHVSHIKPFATTDMVNTFLMGFSPDVLEKVDAETTQSFQNLATKIQTELGAGEIPNLAQHITDAVKECRDNWTYSAWDAHFFPLTRVVGSLPVDEMAALAETLIMLQSLKEKVTQPTESVGGPIDVAVISKGDGFIWIKRKHYFDPALNPRFFQRQREK